MTWWRKSKQKEKHHEQQCLKSLFKCLDFSKIEELKTCNRVTVLLTTKLEFEWDSNEVLVCVCVYVLLDNRTQLALILSLSLSYKYSGLLITSN